MNRAGEQEAGLLRWTPAIHPWRPTGRPYPHAVLGGDSEGCIRSAPPPPASCWLCQWGALASPGVRGRELLKYLVFQLSPWWSPWAGCVPCPQVRAPTRGLSLQPVLCLGLETVSSPTCFQMWGGSDEPFAPPGELYHCCQQLCPEVLYEALKTLPPAAPQNHRAEALERDSGEGAAGPWTTTSPGIGFSLLTLDYSKGWTWDLRPAPTACPGILSLCVWSREGRDRVGSPAGPRGQPSPSLSYPHVAQSAALPGAVRKIVQSPAAQR